MVMEVIYSPNIFRSNTIPFLYVLLVILLEKKASLLIGRNGFGGHSGNFHKRPLFSDSCVALISVLVSTIQRLTDLFSLRLYVCNLLYLLWFFFSGIPSTIFSVHFAVYPRLLTKIPIEKINLFVKKKIQFINVIKYTRKPFFVFIDGLKHVFHCWPCLFGDGTPPEMIENRSPF